MITIQKAPDHWTPDQALAVYEFIDEMRDAIWERYTVQLIELMHEERITTCGGGECGVLMVMLAYVTCLEPT